MTRIYATDLPKHVRARLPQTPMARARRAADTTADVKRETAAGWFRCRDCGGEWTAWLTAERHSRDFHHSRVEWRWVTDGEGAA